MKKFDIFIVLFDLILVALMYYLMLPPINLTSIDFWSFICMIGIIIFISMAIRDSNRIIVKKKFNVKLLNTYKYLFIVYVMLRVIVKELRLIQLMNLLKMLKKLILLRYLLLIKIVVENLEIVRWENLLVGLVNSM